MKHRLILALLISSLPIFAQKINSGKDVIHAMHKMYHGKWYTFFTFTQDAFFYKDGKEQKKEVWHEAASFPGKLVIKYDSMKSGNGVVFANHTVTGIKDGIAKTPRAFIHDLLLVGFDVYFLQPELSCKILDSLGYDLNKVREDVFDNRAVYVVGAEKGNDTIPQFWIDKERLYMHRIVYKKGKQMDVVFRDYVKMEGNWVAKEVIFKSNGELQMVEKYYNIKFPHALKEELFDPKKFMEANW